MPRSGSGAVVRLTLQGMSRVLDSRAGMVFVVDTFSNDGTVAHVRDERYPGPRVGRNFQVWSLGVGDYDVVTPPRTGAGCECCDHYLEHAILEFLNTYDNGCPPIPVGVVVGNLRDRLGTWVENGKPG